MPVDALDLPYDYTPHRLEMITRLTHGLVSWVFHFTMSFIRYGSLTGQSHPRPMTPTTKERRLWDLIDRELNGLQGAKEYVGFVLYLDRFDTELRLRGGASNLIRRIGVG